MKPCLIIGSDRDINAELEQLLDGKCVIFSHYPGWRILEPWMEECSAVFLATPSADACAPLMASLREQWPDLPIICVGRNWSPEDQMRVLTFGARGYLAYPVLPWCLSDQMMRVGCRVELAESVLQG